MTNVLLSSAAAALLRALLARAAAPRGIVLLADARSVDWQSLTMVGERHELWLRIDGREAREIASRLCDGLAEAEFAIRAKVVADIAVVEGPAPSSTGGLELKIEALTISDHA